VNLRLDHDFFISLLVSRPKELIVGAGDKRDLAGIDSPVSAYPMIHIDASIGQLAYDLLKRYAKSDDLRTFDSLIAAAAMVRDFQLVSRNRKLTRRRQPCPVRTDLIKALQSE
jgi:predicted nucleic acid-binding protein